MTYLEVLEILEAAARTVDINATYHRGRLADISLATVTANTNLIYVEDSVQIQPAPDVNTAEQWTIRLGFFRQDSTGSESMDENQSQTNEESREIIFSETLLLARRYLDALYNEEHLQILNVPRLTQVTRIFQGTFTGWGTDIVVRLGVDCDDLTGTEIQNAIYQNSNSTFSENIARGETFTAPDITVTDSDGSTYQHPANTNVTCIQAAVPVTLTIKNTNDDLISTIEIPAGTIHEETIADSTVTLKNSSGDIIATEAIAANTSDDITIPNVSWTNSDGTSESTPYGNSIVCDIAVNDLALYFSFETGHDISALFTNTSGDTWTFTALTQDGSSGSITVSVNGGSYAAFTNPTVISNTQTIRVKRTITASAGSVTITGTYA